nr:MAG TPA: hypothetical protein [Caudoviricetes sp.]
MQTFKFWFVGQFHFTHSIIYIHNVQCLISW